MKTVPFQEVLFGDVDPVITSLFDITKPTMPRAFNTLEGVIRGQVLVDNPSNPTWACVRDGIYGTLYFGGKVTAPIVASVVEQFRQLGEVGIGCWLEDELNDMLPTDHNYDGRTLYFTECFPNTSLMNAKLPFDYTLEIRGRSLLKQSFDFESTIDAFGSLENIMRYTHGFAILHEGKVVCEAATGAPTHGRIEIGVTTHESHRQRGLASIACAHLIRACEAMGYKTWWDCARQNTASVRLARKLGYRNEREYRYVWWKKK